MNDEEFTDMLFCASNGVALILSCTNYHEQCFSLTGLQVNIFISAPNVFRCFFFHLHFKSHINTNSEVQPL